MKVDRIWRSAGGSYAMALVTLRNRTPHNSAPGRLECTALSRKGQKLNNADSFVPPIAPYNSMEEKLMIRVGDLEFERINCVFYYSRR